MNDLDILPLTKHGRLERYHFQEDLVKRLAVDTVLKGHSLCVNRLAWNHDGSCLLSGSDDKRLLLHSFPNYDRLPLSIATEHASNIFGVQFLPSSGGKTLISGAMDSTVQLHHLDAEPETKFRYPSAVGRPAGVGRDCVEVTPRTEIFSCHRERVKDVEIDNGSPHLFWSVSEDGTIRQYDVRCSLASQSQSGASNVIIAVHATNGADSVDLKGLDINQARPHQMAVACGDPYVRVFDRRKLSLGASAFPEPMLRLSPPHLPILCMVEGELCHSTYVNFSHRGDKLVALFHGDHAYAFDICSEGAAACTYVKPSKGPTAQDSLFRNGNLRNGHTDDQPPNLYSFVKFPLSKGAEERRDVAMTRIAGQDYTTGIQHLDEAISFSPGVPSLYTERAHCFLERKLPGDLCFALKDCDQANAIDPTFADGHFFRCRAVDGFGSPQTALRLLRRFQRKFPRNIRLDEVSELKTAIKEKLSKNKKSSATKRSRQADEDGEDDRMELDQEGEGNAASGSSRPSASESTEDDPDNDEILFEYYGEEFKTYEDGQPDGVWWNSEGGRRFLSRFVGQYNVQTDIKECVFVGQNDAFVACGSDDGNVFIYNAETGHPVNVLNADEDVCNCVQCHPTVACLATSGIESVVRLWTPVGEQVDSDQIREQIRRIVTIMKRGRQPRYINQAQMLMRVRMILDNYDLGAVFGDGANDDSSDDEEDGGRAVNCRMV